jgi:hypothetical protein
MRQIPVILVGVRFSYEKAANNCLPGSHRGPGRRGNLYLLSTPGSSTTLKGKAPIILFFGMVLWWIGCALQMYLLKWQRSHQGLAVPIKK